MNSQLPQELKTSKFNSLPDDARRLAEELICDKFGVAEIVEGGSRDRDFFDPSRDVAQLNILHGELRTHQGRGWRFELPLSISSSWDTLGNQPNLDSSFSQIAYKMSRMVQEQIREFESQVHLRMEKPPELEWYKEAYNNDPVTEVWLELNGHRENCRTPHQISDFIKQNL